MFKFEPEKAKAVGYPTNTGFMVKAGSTAMVSGSNERSGKKSTPADLVRPSKQRANRLELISQGVLLRSVDDPELFVFARDYEFRTASAAGIIIRDGNCSGPGRWLRIKDNRTLKEVLEEQRLGRAA